MRYKGFKRLILILSLPAVLILLLAVLFNLYNKGILYENRDTLPGSGSSRNPYLINNEQDYIKFSSTLANGSSPYIYSYIKLMSDLDFSDMEIDIPYSDEGVMFFGYFDGNGHTIKGLNIDKGENPSGLFPDLSGTVCNLRITDSSFRGYYAGGICGLLRITGKVYNCYSDVLAEGEKGSGLIAGDNYGRIENCASEGNTAGIDEKNSYCINCFSKQADYKKLNDYIPKILSNQGIYSWNSDLSFGEYTASVKALKIIYTKGSMPQNVGGFFSYPERKFIFSIPENLKSDSYTMMAVLSDGSSQRFEVSGDNEILQLSDGREIGYQIFYTKDVCSLFIEMKNEDGKRFLSYLKTNEIKAALSVTNEKGQVTLRNRGITLSGRGNDSFRTDKPGYNLEFDKAEMVAGMEADEKFCLLPGYRDDSMFSYIYTRDMFNLMQFEYAPKYKLVNVYMNEEFQGIYMLTENIDISKAAFDLTDMNVATRNKNKMPLYKYPRVEEDGRGRDARRVYYDLPVESDDVTGGYIVAINYNDYLQKRSRFRTARNMLITVKSDQFLGKNQIDYIQDRWQRYEDAVLSRDGYNSRGEYYADLIDMECFAKQWLFYDLVMEQSMDDSIYYYKDSDLKDSRFHAVWYWDAEHAFLTDKRSQKQHIKLEISEELENGGNLKSGIQLFNALAIHEDFQQKLKEQWQRVFYPILSDESIFDRYEQEYPMAVQIDDMCYGTDYRAKIAFVKNVLSKRVPYMNELYGDN